RFVRRAVARFMPGENAGEALAAAGELKKKGIRTVLTHLGENIADAKESESVTEHYLGVLDQVARAGLPTEISVKLTHLGLDLGAELCFTNLRRIIERAGPGSVVWIDMETSGYVDATLELYRRARHAFPNVGVCLQSYLYRTAEDLASLIPLGAAVRLVKGAYKEPADRAFPRKKDVDENFFTLSKQLLGNGARRAGVRVGIATHDLKLIRRIQEHAKSEGLGKEALEFQMLYGIRRAEQIRLAQDGWRTVVLISYGTYWFPWYMRRLAERPANLLFVARNLFAG
ncbi:MAG: proline dehydrogenase family protein, partial [Acidobacteria bacterium]|nr:proline dehydrogenase family protein [Acidobacteriota bacterium]